MTKFLGMRWLVVVAGAAMLLVLAAACGADPEVVEVVKEVVVEKEVPVEVIKEVVVEKEVPVEVVVEKIVEVPGETVYVQPSGEDVPQYGGTITHGETFSWNWDPFDGSFGGFQFSPYLETMGGADWAADRATSPMTSDFFPVDAMAGYLAESWEQPDANTTIFHVRQGVHWADKAPANGREMNALDVEYSWHRLMGYGDKYGFTEPSTIAVDWTNLGLKSVEATDNWTVVFKHDPNIHILTQFMLYGSGQQVVNRETVEKFGDLKDWKNAVGTGPFILTDFVEGSSKTYERNPDYWGSYEFDTRYQLPFIDIYQYLIIQERPTKIAALRTGKLDFDKKVGVLEWQSLVKSNPDIQFRSFFKEGHGAGFPLDDPSKPWADIRVRKAMQMAINRAEIAETLYAGLIPSDPAPLLGMDILEFITPFADWPADLKEEYTYDPEGAKALLAEAGYPDGFEAEFWYDSSGDQDPAQVPPIQSYLADIGVQLELVPMEMGMFWDLIHSDELTEMIYDWSSFSYEPMGVIPRQLTADGYMAWGGEWKDPTIAGLVDGILNAPNYDSYRSDVRELYMYYAAQHFKILGTSIPAVVVWHPWVKGYFGERDMGSIGQGALFARMWIDQPLKAAMGY